MSNALASFTRCKKISILLAAQSFGDWTTKAKPAPRPLSERRSRSRLGGGQLRFTWHVGAAPVGETGSGHVISWRRAGGRRTGCETAVRPHDRTRRHSDLISRQCRIVSKWRGILAPRRTFKSTAGRRTDDLSPTLRKKRKPLLLARRVGLTVTFLPSFPCAIKALLSHSLSLYLLVISPRK